MGVEEALQIATQYYTPTVLQHCKRVQQYILQNELLTDDELEVCAVVALLHDLFEDTSCAHSVIYDPVVFSAVCLLTKPPHEPYVEYINEIRRRRGKDFIGRVAWFVKIADMKDHLAQSETLTPKLLDKYVKALPYLL